MTDGVLVVLVGLGAGATGFLLGRVLRFRAATREVRTMRDELARRLDELFALHELTYLLAESLEPARISEHLADYLERFFTARGALVALLREAPGTIWIPAASGTLADVAGREIDAGDAGLVAAAMGREHMELAERGDPGAAPVLFAGRSVERAAVVPLRAHGLPLGAVAIADAPRPFPTAELRLLSTVATHAAAVLSNGRFFELVQRARDEWESTFDALGAGLALVDDQNAIRRANRALADLTGRPVEDLIGSPLVAAVGGDVADLAGRLEMVRAGGRFASGVHEAARLGRLLRVTAAPMHAAGPGTWVVVLIEDITEQKLLELQLVQNEKMTAVGQLVSGVAHELNNPLTSIAGLAEFLLERGQLGDPAREHLEVMREQAERAGLIVRNLLTFARRGPAEVTDLDLNDIVQRTVALVGHELRLRDVALEETLDPALPRVRGDRYQIQQVVVNLVTNALQAVEDNPAGRPRAIRVATTTEDGHVVLRVADTGPGVPHGASSQIFMPFFTTKAPGKGTGLGLAIAFRIVQGHGGQLGVRQRPEGGAEFMMRLPQDAEPVDRRSPPSGTVRAMPVPLRGSGQQLLVVDADPAVRRMIAVLLGEAGIGIEAADAARAAALLATRRFDLVIADPRALVDGGERFGDHLLTRHPALKDRTIFLTADVRPETQAWLRQLGCLYFVKPFPVGDLKAAAATLLAGGSA